MSEAVQQSLVCSRTVFHRFPVGIGLGRYIHRKLSDGFGPSTGKFASRIIVSLQCFCNGQSALCTWISSSQNSFAITVSKINGCGASPDENQHNRLSCLYDCFEQLFLMSGQIEAATCTAFAGGALVISQYQWCSHK